MAWSTLLLRQRRQQLEQRGLQERNRAPCYLDINPAAWFDPARPYDSDAVRRLGLTARRARDAVMFELRCAR
jgi:hypothetical protein